MYDKFLMLEQEYQNIKERAKKCGENGDELAVAIWNRAEHRWGPDGVKAEKEYQEQLRILYGKPVYELTSIDEMWNQKLRNSLIALVGEKGQKDIEDISRLALKGQFSTGMYRRSYRSDDFKHHAETIFRDLQYWIRWLQYGQPVTEFIKYKGTYNYYGLEKFIALEISRENEELIGMLKDAILGDNSEIILSYSMIKGIIISGHEELMDLLLKLLDAAKLQEGVRQQVLENADAGTRESFAKILAFCIEHDMFRFSASIRAFCTWTGLALDNMRPAMIKKYTQIAYECLTDENARAIYLESNNNLELYLALWGYGCKEADDADRIVSELMKSDDKHRKVLGWSFVCNSDVARLKASQALENLDERDDEILAWVLNALQTVTDAYRYSMWDKLKEQAVNNIYIPGNKEEQKELFAKLKAVVDYVGQKNTVFKENPFPYSEITLNVNVAIKTLVYFTTCVGDDEMEKIVADYRNIMDADLRGEFYVFYCKKDNEKSRAYLRDALKDKSSDTRKWAVKEMSKLKLEETDFDTLIEGLLSKSAPQRKNILKIFLSQDNETVSVLIDRLISSRKDFHVQAGLELILENKETLGKEKKNLIEELNKDSAKLTSQTIVLLDQVNAFYNDSQVEWTSKNGFGLYDVKAVEDMADEVKQTITNYEGYTLDELHNMMVISKSELLGLSERIGEIIEKHKDFEYETRWWDGSVTTVLLGNATTSINYIYKDENKNAYDLYLENIPFSDEFAAVFDEYMNDAERMAALYYTVEYINDNMYYHYRGDGYVEWYQKICDNVEVSYKRDEFKYFGIISQITKLLVSKRDNAKLLEQYLKLYLSLVNIVGFDRLGTDVIKPNDKGYVYPLCSLEDSLLVNLRKLMYSAMIHIEDKNDFKEFSQRWLLKELAIEILVNKAFRSDVSYDSYFNLYKFGFISRDVMLYLLIGSKRNDKFMMQVERLAQNKRKQEEYFNEYPGMKEIVSTVKDRVLEIEEKRGEQPTEVTRVARQIKSSQGAGHFVKLLTALGKENFYRGYMYSGEDTKQCILSNLLKGCYPTETDNAKSMKELLDKTDISDNRLVEACMYAPQWADLAEEITGWKGLKKGVWFFHAHVNENFSAEKETVVALYSSISPKRFNDGAFDKDWFLDAYNQLGEKRFKVLYKSAKYITSGSNQHRRSQLYSDAVLGKIDADALKAEIIEKRNQEKLRCYTLIPIDKSKKNDALERYEFVQQFLKESKQFGSQRKESEKQACQTSMENLAITTGLKDVNRLTWYMESEKMNEYKPLMKPHKLGEVSVWLEIDDKGDASLAIEKNGKRQKTVPKAIAKDELVVSLKEMIKELKEQKRRAKESLERAMTERNVFLFDELNKITGNPVLSPMLFSLVWVQDKKDGICGFLERDDKNLLLRTISGENIKLTKKDKLFIAHPYDLISSNVWSEYMHYLYENSIVQPFKQVFREYYPMTEDEKKEKKLSRRYAGHQVQPSKTVALLKGRGWTVDYYDGLQKVYHDEDIVVRMYAMADWFSPADIEAPTLEEIHFYDRNNWETLDIDKLPPVLFSEVMRDIDMVVSVAHVGGVDPEASLSTVELRCAIAKELVSFMKLDNVTFSGSHAMIKGSLAEYSVHLGSGVVHAAGIGMLSILPVHSQARGRIFLPFADDDPRTAEVVSKILLLAEDSKIKDIAILSQINR